ncbi:hypothetical protein JCM11641_002942 [Rhodosporidiobolus odoratus]
MASPSPLSSTSSSDSNSDSAPNPHQTAPTDSAAVEAPVDSQQSTLTVRPCWLTEFLAQEPPATPPPPTLLTYDQLFLALVGRASSSRSPPSFDRVGSAEQSARTNDDAGVGDGLEVGGQGSDGAFDSQVNTVSQP